jgi:tetratricopeptide (TPR) repeat protein
VAEACAYLNNAPRENDPLEYIFGDLLDTFTATETAVLAALTHFTGPAPVRWIADMASLGERQAQTALEDLTNRALLAEDPAGQTFHLPPLASKFLRDKRPEAVAQTGDRLADRAYALALENGYDKYDRFPVLEAEWPALAAALPRLVEGENTRLQKTCAALRSFLDFSGRWDEWLSLEVQAEGKALAANDFCSAGWRAYGTGWVSHLRGQPTEVLDSAARAEAHWKRAKAGPRGEASAIRLRGMAFALEKNYSAARAAYQQSLKLFLPVNPEGEDVAKVLNDLASVETLSLDYAAAERDYREVLRIATKIGYREGAAYCTGNLSLLALNRRDWPAAETLAREALSLDEGVGRQELIALDCNRLAWALAGQGRSAEGLPYARRAVEIFMKLRKPDGLAAAQATLKECESA